MKRISPRSSSPSDSPPTNLTHLNPSQPSIPQCTVLLWDPRPSRRQLISRIILECGARPHCLAEPEAIAPGECSRCCTLAVVALGASFSLGASSLAYIHSLKRQGFRVICYEDDAQSWPLSLRCQVLLAGSSWLLDSTKAEFTQEVRRLLAGLLQANSGRRNEEERVKRVMKQLGSVGESQAILAVFHTVLRISRLSDLPVLITGETGTGKELLAHAIHQLDLKRRYGPFVALNCSAISSGLAESELFGHRRGAFTGANRDRKGLIRSAEGGILFLDEVGELDDALQAKLLRVLQEPRVLAVGEEREIAVNVRIVAATNRDLAAMVQRGQFRADLFHRLHILPIHIPPLRERPMDLRPLVEHFLEKHQLLKPEWTPTVAADFLEALMQLELAGNARQLENLVRWVLVNKDDDAPLSLSDLPLEVWQQLSDPGIGPCAEPQPGDDTVEVQTSASEALRQDIPIHFANLLAINGWNLSRSLQFCEKLLLEAALYKARGNQSQTARLLGITPRSVYNKLHKHQIHQ